MATIANLLIRLGVDTRDVKQAEKAAPVAEAAGQKTGRSFAAGFRKTVAMVGKIAATAALAGGVAAGGMLAQGLQGALEKSKVDALLSAQIGATPEMAAKAGQIAGNLYKQGFGDSAAGVADAVKAVFQGGLIDADAATADIEKVAGRATQVAQILGADYDELGASVGTMLKTGIAKNAEEAFDVLVRGAQLGANKGQDLLDVYSEYGVHFQALGVDAATSMGLINQAVSTGAFNADKAADALKEFSIRAVDGSSAAADSFKALGFNAEKMQRVFAKGGPEAAAAFGQVITRLKQTEGQANHAQIAFGLLGTQSEDLKGALLAMDPATAAASLGELEGAAGRAGDMLQNNAGAKVDQFKRRIETAFIDAAAAALPALEGIVSRAESIDWEGLFADGAAALQQLAPMFRQLATDAGPGLFDTLRVGGEVFSFLADHADLLAKALPYLIAGFIAVKVAQVGANAAAALSPVLTIADMMAKRRLAAANTQLAIAMTSITAAAGTQAAAQGVSTAATTAGDAAQKRSLLSSIAMRAAALAGAAATGIATAAQWAWNIAMSANPIGLIIIAIIALVAAIVVLWKKNEGFRNMVMAVWAAIQSAIGATVDWLKEYVPPIWAFIVKAITAYVKLVLTVIKFYWSLIVAAVMWAVDRVKAIIAGVKAIIAVVRAAFDRARAGAVDRLSALISFVTGIPGKIVSLLSGLRDKMLDIGRSIVQGLRDGIAGAWHMVTSKVTELTNLIPNGVRDLLGIASPSRVMRDLMRHVGEGAALGLADSEHTIRRAAARMASAAPMAITGAPPRPDGPAWRPPPPPPPAAGATAGGGGDTHYHFAGAAPTEQQIAAIEARRARRARPGRKG